ncbi:MAG TPA: pepsin-like aspartic protease [Methylomirabilota bacterium]|nr:pepsin-like aspartic protease [Methylomirabilota bacterium]
MSTKPVMATKTVRVPINNVPGGGDYTAQVTIGSQNAPVNLIMDTGSSTLAVKHGASYHASTDKNLKPTVYAQEVMYGTGGWAGPVIQTSVAMGVQGSTVTLQNSFVAIADDQQPHNFGAADGILGLAYNALNNAFNLTSYLQQQRINPAVTYPWPFPIKNSNAMLSQLEQLFGKLPQEDIPPYFDEVESSGITANKFSFYTLRSVPNMRGGDATKDPLNNGFFILGGGEDQADLFTGQFVYVDVVDDAWYNTQLNAVQVDGCNAVNAKPLPSKYDQTMISNSIVDSGTNALFLASDVFEAVIESLNQLNPSFIQLIQKAMKAGLPMADLDLAKWPNINFIMKGENGQDVKLTCTPQTYWQTNAPKAGQAMFQILNGQSVQSILGLPLMNNYFTVFDRSQDSYGVIGFAPIKHN